MEVWELVSIFSERLDSRLNQKSFQPCDEAVESRPCITRLTDLSE